MKNILTIIKKEFAKFFGDKRLLFTACVLPGLMIYVIYSLFGGFIGKMQEEATDPLAPDQTGASTVYVCNLPQSIENEFKKNGIYVNKIQMDGVDEIISGVTESEMLLCVVFPQDFDSQISGYSTLTADAPPPNIEIYYNSAVLKSASAYNRMEGLLNEYEESITNKFDVNRPDPAGDPELYNLASDKDVSGSIATLMLPLLMIMFIFTGCLTVAPESIAGEKERGTIAALLVTEIKRSEIALGKILSLMVIALLCGCSSLFGMILSIRKLFGVNASDMSISYYTATDFLLLTVVALSTILFIVSVLTNISAFAKSVKEALTMANPLLIVVILAGVTSMMSFSSDPAYYLIPIYNSAQCITSILAFKCDLINLGITVVSNLIYSAAGVVLLSRMFNSERIVFTR